MTTKELREKQELYLSMVDEDTRKLIQTLDTYQISKKNCMLIYGFLVYLTQKGVDYTKLQSTGRQANAYKLNTKVDTNWIISSLKTISTWTGVCINSVQTSIQHLVNLGIIETRVRHDDEDLIRKVDTVYVNEYVNKGNCIDCLSDLEYKRLYNGIKSDLKMELIELITEALSKATDNLKTELENYIDTKLNEIKGELVETRQVAIDNANSNAANSNNPNWTKLKQKREKVWDSINKFLANVPAMSEKEIAECRDKYVQALSNGCYDRQDYLDNAIANLNTKLSKAKLNAVKSIAPPEHLLKRLPNPSKTNPQEFVNSLVMYTQEAAQQLSNDSKNSDYRDKIEGYRQWHYRNLIETFAPVLQELREDLDAEERVIQIWNKNVLQLDHPEFVY